MKGRLEWVDISKGILIILVIVGHILPVDMSSDIAVKFRLWIYSCHIPAFFIFNGWLKYEGGFQKLTTFVSLLRKQKRVWNMYLLFSLIFFVRYLLQIIVGYNTYQDGLLFIEHICLGVGEGVLWFIPTFLIAEWLFYVSRKNVVMGGGIILVLILLYFYKNIFITESISDISNVLVLLYIVLMRSLVGVIFMWIGFWANKFTFFDSKIVISLSTFSAFAYINHDVDINNLVFHNEILYVFFAFWGTVLVINLAKCISKTRYPKLFLSFFGKESLFVMLTHTILFIIQSALLLSTKIFSSQLYSLLFAILISIVLQYILVKVKRKVFNEYPKLNNHFI